MSTRDENLDNKRILILYERKSRELENCIILKYILEKNGYQCLISHFLDASNFCYFSDTQYYCLIVPHLYTTQSVYRNMVRFGRFKFIINMQYEQVLSEKWELLGHHNPQGVAKNALHICWGNLTRTRLISSGVPQENCIITGAIQMDMLRNEFRSNTVDVKYNLAKTYGLDGNRSWTLFLSSFTYADISTQRLKMNEAVAGTDLKDIVPYYTDSRNILLEWFDALLEKDTEQLFIYRPHPDELNLDSVMILANKYSNFIIIGDGSAKSWIEASDKSYTWYSTTVVEAQLLDKSCAILRPIPLPGDFDSVLLKKGVFIKNLKDFLNLHISKENNNYKPIKHEHIEEYYQTTELPAFINILNLINSLDYQNSLSIKIPFHAKITNQFKSIAIGLINIIKDINIINLDGKSLGNNNSFLHQWMLEMNNQFFTTEELDIISRKILPKLNNIK